MEDHFRPIRKDYPTRPAYRLHRQRGSILLLVLALVCFSFAGISFPGGAASAEGGKPEADSRRLAGRWVRPDGGYILELSDVHEGGSLKASYFNPRPIKVSQAVWSRRNGEISVIVELRDINYPGSTYNLRYDPKNDRLMGTYFQAMEKQTFDVQFVRTK